MMSLGEGEKLEENTRRILQLPDDAGSTAGRTRAICASAVPGA
jgi:hypothetical protein